MPSRTAFADLVGAYVAYTRELYPSREWMNVRAALSRLVPHVRDLDRRSIRLALDELELEREISVAYRRQVWNRWRRFIRWAVEHDHAPAELAFHCATWRPRFATPEISDDEDLGELVQPEDTRFTLEFQHIRNVLEYLPQPSRDLVRLLALTGARPSEIVKLRTVDVDLERACARLKRHKNAERGLARTIAFNAESMKLLDRRLRPFTPADWLFPAPRDPSRFVTVDVVAQQLRRTLRRHEELVPFTLYDLRRLAARTIRAHASLDHAQALLGHASTRTTEIYAPARDDIADDAALILEREAQL